METDEKDKNKIDSLENTDKLYLYDSDEDLNQKHDLQMDGYDVFYIILLSFFGIFTRVWIIQYPRHPVDQEELILQKINFYLNGTFFVDSQPPFSLLLLSFIAKMAEYNGSYIFPNTETNYTYPDMTYVSIRMPSAFLSSILIPVSYIIVRLLNCSSFTAFSCGFLFVFDSFYVSISRNISTDGFIQFYIGIALMLTFLTKHLKDDTSKVFTSSFASLFAGLSLASDWSCLSVVILINLYFYYVLRSPKYVSLNLSLSSSVFLLSYFVHCLILPYHSEYTVHVSNRYYRTLVSYDSPLNSNAFNSLLNSIEIIFVSLKMHLKSVSLYDPLSLASMKSGWKVLWKQNQRVVACFGNPITWNSIIISSFLTSIKTYITKRYYSSLNMLLLAYIISLLFMFLSERGLPDYKVPLTFGMIFFALFLDLEFDTTLSGFIQTSYCIVSLFLFILYAPLTYAYEHFDKRFLPFFAIDYNNVSFD